MLLPVLLAAAVFLPGCEAVFTSAPLAFMQRDPSKLSPDQKMAFAENALASGDAESISVAYAAIADYIDSTSLSGSQAVEYNGMAADLLAADTGVASLFDQVVAGFVAGEEPDPAEIEQMVLDLGVTSSDGTAMGAYMDSVTANGGTPEPMQAVLAAGVIVAPVIDTVSSGDPEYDAAKAILQDAAAGMEDDSTLSDMADMLGITL